MQHGYFHPLGTNWRPERLRDEPVVTAAERLQYRTAVHREISPTLTIITTTRILASCPDRQQHMGQAERPDKENCPDCRAAFTTCPFHWVHHDCNPSTVLTTHHPTDAVRDDDGTLLQGGLRTDFTKPAPDKLRTGWAKSPANTRQQVNDLLHHLEDALRTAQALADSTLLITNAGLDATATLRQMEDSLAKARTLDDPAAPPGTTATCRPGPD